MEALVTTLETSKRLKAAGFPQTTKLSWYRSENESTYWHVIVDTIEPSDNNIAAPTAHEMADLLDDTLTVFKGETAVESGKYWAQYTSGYDDYAKDTEVSGKWCDTLVEALALLWLKLQEEK